MAQKSCRFLEEAVAGRKERDRNLLTKLRALWWKREVDYGRRARKVLAIGKTAGKKLRAVCTICIKSIAEATFKM